MSLQSNIIPAAPAFVSPKGRAIALARLDILRAWQDFRAAGRKRGLGNVPAPLAVSDADFIAAYNTGTLFPALFDTLGPISKATLYNWRSLLSGTENWTLLVPQYYAPEKSGARLTPEEEHIFLGLLLHPNKIKIGKAISHTALALQHRGIQVVHSPMTFRRFAEDYKAKHFDRWTFLREGEKALMDKVTFSIRRDPSLLSVGEVLVTDGHKLNFQVVNPYTGKPCRATMVGYLDWKSWDLVGYEIMVEENTQCIASAFRNAVLRLGHAPSVVYMDNGKAFRARFFTATESLEESGVYGLFARLGTKIVFSRPYNARAKVIERWWLEFSEGFERLLPSYIGASIEDKPAHLMRNERWHKAMHASYVPTIPEAIEMIAEWHEHHRSRKCPHVPGKTIGEVFDEGRDAGLGLPSKSNGTNSDRSHTSSRNGTNSDRSHTSSRNGTAVIDPRELDDLMMTVKASRIGPNGIRFLGADYYHEVFHGLREQCTIRYSLFDLSFVLVYDASGSYLCRAERPALAHPIASITGNAADMETIKRLNHAQKALKKQTMIEATEERRALTTEEIEWTLPRERKAVPGTRTVQPILPIPTEEQIPEGAFSEQGGRGRSTEDVKASDLMDRTDQPDLTELQNPARPVFIGPTAMTQRYEWHLANGTHDEEEEAWVAWYKTTEYYKAQFEYFEQQAEKSPARQLTNAGHNLSASSS
jgi:putative transposase